MNGSNKTIKAIFENTPETNTASRDVFESIPISNSVAIGTLLTNYTNFVRALLIVLDTDDIVTPS